MQKYFYLIVFIFSINPLLTQDEKNEFIRGELIWSREKQIITDCKSGSVYWIRVLASNPNFLLYKKVKELTLNGEVSIIAEFRGSLKLGTASISPPYPTDGTFNVYNIISVKKGSCKK